MIQATIFINRIFQNNSLACDTPKLNNNELTRDLIKVSKIKLEIETKLSEAFKGHLSSSNRQFLDLADENLQKHNKDAKKNLEAQT